MIIHSGGVDCSGKSTLVKYLSKSLNYPTKHFDKPKDMEDGKRQYFNFIKSNRNNWICDRLHDGEWIYAPLYRGYMANYLQEFERELIKNNNYVFLYVKAELETIFERARTRGEDFVKEEHFQTVLDYYSKYVLKQKMPFIEIDTTNASVGDGVKKAKDATKKVNHIWNQIREFNKDVPKMIKKKKVFPRGNVYSKHMLILPTPSLWVEEDYYTILSGEPGYDDILNLIQEKGIEKDTWFTSLLPSPTLDGKVYETQIEKTKDIIIYQYNAIQPEKILTIDETTKVQLESLFPNTEIILLNNL